MSNARHHAEWLSLLEVSGPFLSLPELLQHMLFISKVCEQALRNQNALQLRLSQIPREIELEKAAIDARYASPEPRLFPVEVTFLVSEKLT